MAKMNLPVPCELLALMELARGSGCGFEIRERFVARIKPLPGPTTTSFYCALNRLVRVGYAVRVTERTPLRRGRTGQPRKFFVITDAGRERAIELSEGLRNSLLPPATPSTPKV